MKSFKEIFEELARHNDRSVIWNEWLDYAIEANLIYNPKPKTNYHNKHETYYEMISSWINELTKELETKPYYDMLGQFYEELVQSRSKGKSLGQMYTPQSVSDLISELTFNEPEGVVNDPTCGSARMLLAAHVKHQGRMYCIGQDLDETSCKMAVLNFWSHGVRGSILHMDTLEGTFFKAWRVNNYLYDGLPVPHIELVSQREAYRFIGYKVNSIDGISNDNEKSIGGEYKPVGTGQTTLM